MAEDTRRHVRSRKLLSALAFVGDGPVSSICVIDISATGARLRLSDEQLPSTFVLVIPRLRLAMTVVRRWSAGRHMGVAFLEERPALADVAPARHVRERERRLWREALDARA